jgi:cytochrome c oxidase subunit 2
MKLDSTRWGILGVAAVLGLGSVAVHVAAQTGERVIQIQAKRFDYTPGEIRLKKGVPVVLEFTTQDVVMGFSAPDLNARTDIVPGKVARVRLVPDRIGSFDFHCDIFCGSGHEEMTGQIVVTE